MTIPLLKGRRFTVHDVGSSLPVAIINEAARQTSPGQDPVGKYLTNFGPKASTAAIVGMWSADVRHVA